MIKIRILLTIIPLIMMFGCATIPPGPSVMVLPPSGKSFETFQADDYACREWAASQTEWQANDTVNQNRVSGAAIGTLLGAGLGAIIGSASGNVGAGAGIGAAGGLILGTAGAENQAQISGHDVQRRYDIAYQQCMHSKGNQIPSVTYERRVSRYVLPPHGYYRGDWGYPILPPPHGIYPP
ncbi:MAG: hypothetical protein WA151_12405 [Desulfatirhabdiaceae bacterium]